MTPLHISFFGDEDTTLQIDAELTAPHFELTGERIAFDHSTRINLKADDRLIGHVRFSTSRDASQYLFKRLEQANFKVIGKGFEITLIGSRLTIRVKYRNVATTGSWSYDPQNDDFTQVMTIDETISPIERVRGIPTRTLVKPLREPNIPCYLSVKIRIADPLKMQVADRVEPVENKAVVSTGRPESNRRRF